ncbi:DUF2201 family putative metallopeptidase [Lentzea sp. NEAU-D7]|uniref:vWA domain-containing protein n=1 Tax=Lentzea sp. NEAU-D7 TaxID=2994667 RepID=UPI00224A8D0A|nr:hypothetical protein [Lentzea sp. NEAU-D7]MCX2947041.1 hypothetical protein [Lentzea sp. NEAU-D7]
MGYRKRTPVVDLTDRRALVDWRPAADEVIAEAERLKEAALLDFGLTESAVASWLFSKCHHQIATTAIGTAAVVASGDGTCLLLFNPVFFVGIGLDGVKFVLFHEARHLVHRHLFVEQELREDPVFTLAAEVVINHVAQVRLGRTLPVLDGKPVGIDPAEIHARYVEDLTGQGLVPLAYRDFIVMDTTVYSELKRMRNPPVPAPLCVHVTHEVQLDQATVDAVASSALLNSLLAARRGHGNAESELLDLLNRTEDVAAEAWGRLGAGVLRGTTARTGQVDWWQRWLVDVLASKLREGERLVYPKKRGAVLTVLGHDPMLSRRGPVREKVLVIAYDTSGSMPQSVVTWMTELVGGIEGVQAHWLAFDGVVMPFRLGESVSGGGGTSFQVVVDHVEGRSTVDGEYFEERPDAVIVLTDGYAPHVTPAEPDKWIWLITEGGDDWPDHHTPPMACHRVRPVTGRSR